MRFQVTNGLLREHAPVYFLNDSGSPTWAGKAVPEMTAEEAISMLQFCFDEGARQGWSDQSASTNAVDPEGSCSFHVRFAGGLPRDVWCMRYAMGAHAQRDGRRVMEEVFPAESQEEIE